MSSNSVICCGRRRTCVKVRCYHRRKHQFTNNCKVGTALDTGSYWCSVIKDFVKCKQFDETEVTK